MIEVKKATRDLVEEYYGHPMIRSCVAYVAVEDGTPICVAGYYNDTNHRVLFSSMKPAMRRYPVLMYKTARMIVREALTSRAPLYAVADQCVDASDRFLKRLGFTHVKGGIWRWATQ